MRQLKLSSFFFFFSCKQKRSYHEWFEKFNLQLSWMLSTKGEKGVLACIIVSYPCSVFEDFPTPSGPILLELNKNTWRQNHINLCSKSTWHSVSWEKNKKKGAGNPEMTATYHWPALIPGIVHACPLRRKKNINWQPSPLGATITLSPLLLSSDNK